jgi:hypothetical protein
MGLHKCESVRARLIHTSNKSASSPDRSNDSVHRHCHLNMSSERVAMPRTDSVSTPNDSGRIENFESSGCKIAADVDNTTDDTVGD